MIAIAPLFILALSGFFILIANILGAKLGFLYVLQDDILRIGALIFAALILPLCQRQDGHVSLHLQPAWIQKPLPSKILLVLKSALLMLFYLVLALSLAYGAWVKFQIGETNAAGWIIAPFYLLMSLSFLFCAFYVLRTRLCMKAG